MAGEAHRDQDCAADCHSGRMCCPFSLEGIQHGLVDENQKVRTICALALSGLAKAAAPFGIESFEFVLKSLWKGVRSHRGKVLAAFLKTIWFHYTFDGCDVFQLLHERRYGYSYQGVCNPRRGDE